MKAKKKALALFMCVAMLAVAAIGGTLAWYTDADGTMTNTFTIGEGVEIELDEEVDVDGAGKVEENEDGAKYIGVMPGDKLTKKVSVTNTGGTEAYVRVFVTVNNALEINNAIDEYYEAKDYTADQIQAIYDEVFPGWGINYNKVDDEGEALGMRLTITGGDMPKGVDYVDSVKTIDEYTIVATNNLFENESTVITDGDFDGYYSGYEKNIEKNGTVIASIDKMGIYELRYVYYMVLEPEESVTLFEGLNAPTYFDEEQMEMFRDLEIDVYAEAIQTANIGDYEADKADAYQKAFAAFAGEKIYDVKVSNSEELAAAIEAGKTEIWLNPGTYQAPAAAKGKTLAISGTTDAVLEVVPAGQGEAGGQLDYSFDGSTVTFDGITIKTNSQLYAGYARLSGTYNNCVIQNTYNLGVGDSSFKNCQFNITNEYLRVGGANSATFDGCTFNTDGRAILVFQDGTNVAQTVTVKNCTFNATAAANTWNGIHVAAVSIDGTNGTYVVNLEGNNTVDSDFNGLWQIKAGEANVTVNE